MTIPDDQQRVNPYAVTQGMDDGAAKDLDPLHSFMTRRRVSFGLAVVLYVGSLVSAGLACLDIETIVGSGPFMVGVSIAVLVANRRTELRRFRYQAFATIGFCVLCFLLIWGFELSPTQAQRPMACLVVAFALLMNTQWAGWYSSRRHGIDSAESIATGDPSS